MRNTIENQNKCPAWAFYANRLGCSEYEEDEQDEITRRSEGTLVHRTLELVLAKIVKHRDQSTIVWMSLNSHNHI